MIMVNDRIIVCSKCGALYDLHYIMNVKMEKGVVKEFECKNCGMVKVTYKNLDHFKEEKRSEAQNDLSS